MFQLCKLIQHHPKLSSMISVYHDMTWYDVRNAFLRPCTSGACSNCASLSKCVISILWHDKCMLRSELAHLDHAPTVHAMILAQILHPNLRLTQPFCLQVANNYSKPIPLHFTPTHYLHTLTHNNSILHYISLYTFHPLTHYTPSFPFYLYLL